MSIGNRSPRLDEQRAEPRRRIDRLERILLRGSAIPAVPAGQSTPPFSFPGLVVVSSTTPLWYASRDITYLAARISARVPGSGDCDVDFHVNGSTLLTLTLASGDQTDVFATVFSIADGDYFDFAVTATAGQTDVSIQPIESPS